MRVISQEGSADYPYDTLIFKINPNNKCQIIVTETLEDEEGIVVAEYKDETKIFDTGKQTAKAVFDCLSLVYISDTNVTVELPKDTEKEVHKYLNQCHDVADRAEEMEQLRYEELRARLEYFRGNPHAASATGDKLDYSNPIESILAENSFFTPINLNEAIEDDEEEEVDDGSEQKHVPADS